MFHKLKLQSLPLVLLIVALLASAMIVPNIVAHAINTPWLTTSGRFINDPSGNHVILRGVSLVDVGVANKAGRGRTAIQLIDMATDSTTGWFARVIRLPVYPDAIDGTPGWNAGPDAYFNNHLNPAVQECIARQIYCIIDWHYISDYNNSTIDTSTRNFWTYMAPKYANTPNVIYELYNEPINPNDWNTWKTWAQPWVNIIRAAAPNNLILIGGPSWSQNVSQAATSPFTGGNIAYVAHVYPQHGGQSVWDSWFGNSSATVPYFITEWGWQNGGGTPTSGTLSGYGTPFSAYLDSKGVSWTAWVFDDIWQPVMFDTSWNLLGGENYMGQFTHDFLNLHQNDNLPGGGTGPTATRTNTPVGPTATRTNTPIGPTATRTNTPIGPTATSGGGGGGCSNPTVITGGGSYAVSTSATCFKYVNTANRWGTMWTVMNSSSSAANTLNWYGGRTETVTSCINDSQILNGNGAQLNNFTVGKDSTGATYLTITGSAANTVSISVQNWQNGTGCSVAPTPVGSGPANTPAPATATRTNTPIGPTNTPMPPTATRTNTPIGPTNTPVSGALVVQINKGNGTDNTQATGFNFLLKNTGASAVSNLSTRIYFTTDGSNAASGYLLEKYYDQSGVATISGPTLACGSTYYFTVTYGTASLVAGAQWEFQTALHLSSWASTYSGADDWYHSGYAVGALPASYTTTSFIPAYVSGALSSGSIPSCGGTAVPTATNTPVGPTATRTNTPIGPTATNTSTGPTVTPTRTATATATLIGPTPTPPPAGTHLANPFSGATWYVNPDWAAEVNASNVSASAKSAVSHQSTAVWLDSIGSLNGTNGSRGLIGHLDAAVAQGVNLITIVVYDLPNRDCSALASNGELLIAQNGFNRYKTEYIDVLAADIASKPAYANLRIIAIIEPDSLPNLITNTSIPKCQEATGPGGYVESTQYTLNKLYPLRNVYSYIDIGHAGWLGWPNNFNPAITLISNMIKGTAHGVNSVDGFIDNTANNQVEVEPYMTANQMISGSPVRSAFFFSYNDYIDEAAYATAWKAAMQAAQLPASSTNMLLDTSRNGWGGCGGGSNMSAPCRPTGPSTSAVLETFVNASRIDRRPAKGDWCNQNGAGLGKFPTGNALTPYQAYVWVKPPGESDGSSTLIPTGPDNPDGKGFDRMCDPTYGGNSLNQNQNTNALPNAPVSGRWFEAQFDQLVANAFPAIP